jgi:hypothetical protein
LVQILLRFKHAEDVKLADEPNEFALFIHYWGARSVRSQQFNGNAHRVLVPSHDKIVRRMNLSDSLEPSGRNTRSHQSGHGHLLLRVIKRLGSFGTEPSTSGSRNAVILLSPRFRCAVAEAIAFCTGFRRALTAIALRCTEAM